MNTGMCQTDTIRLILGLAIGLQAGLAQTQTGARLDPDWRRIGAATVELGLADPVTGPVKRVWYSADGSRLYAQSAADYVFETVDFENWARSAAAVTPPVEIPPAGDWPALPGARVVSAPRVGLKSYAFAKDLYRTEDGGRSWTNLTSGGKNSVIGAGISDVAVSPAEPEQLAVANAFGVWRSLDGGMTWAGLNGNLPNLPVERIEDAPGRGQRIQIRLDRLGLAEYRPGLGKNWYPAAKPQDDPEAEWREQASASLSAEITAVSSAAAWMYAGSGDGRIWVSADRGLTWRQSPESWGARVTRFHVDSADPRIALAAISGESAHLVRTTNGGAAWDDLVANLPNGPVHGVTADRTSGDVYVATDQGVFYSRQDLDGRGPAAPWQRITGRLPAARAVDVKLDGSGNQLYVAMEGYGVYAAMAPHRAEVLRLVNAGDFSSRPGAPGSLLSVLGGRITQARAGNLNFPVLAASEEESQIQVPFEAAGSVLSLALETAGRSLVLPLALQNVSPAIFVDRDGVPLLLDADSGMMLGAGNNARAGMRIQILATGLGRVRPAWPTGLPAPLENPPAVTTPLAVFLDRTPIEVTKATLAPGYVGLYVVEVQLPALVNAGQAELYISADSQVSNRISISLEP